MAKLVFGAAVFFFGFVSFSLPAPAQSVTLNICNTGKVELDAIFSSAGQVFNSKIRPAACAAVAKSEGGGMEPGYLGLAFTDSRGQYGAARRFDAVPYMGVKEMDGSTWLAMKARGEKIPAPPRTLTLADGSRTVQRGNVSVPLQLLFQPSFPECQKVSTGGGAVIGNTTFVEVTNICEDLGYTLVAETHLDSHEIYLESRSTSGALSQNAPYTISERPEIDWAEEKAKREAREQPVPVKWSDLLAALRNPVYPPKSGKLREALPGYFVVRGTVAGVEVIVEFMERPDGPPKNIPLAQITFRESPAVPHWRPDFRPTPEFNVCTERLDILQERFGADFRTSMIGKPIEVHGELYGAACRGQRASFQIYLGRQIRPVASAVFAADARVWVPPAVVVPPPPRLLTIDELAGNIVEAALKSSYQDNHQKLDAACRDQTNKAHKANPANYEAINKEYMACLAAIDGKMAAMPAPQRSAEKAKPCAQQLLKAYPDGDRIDPHGFQNGLRACVQAYLGNPALASTPQAAPTPPVAPAVAPTAAPIPARASPAPSQAAPVAAAPPRAAQDAQSPNQKFDACMQQAAKDHSDGGRIDGEGYQKAVLSCLQPQQAQPAKR